MTKSTSLSRRNLISFAGAATIIPLGFSSGFAPRALAATPPVPPPLEVYGKLPAIEKVALSPDGQRVAMVATKDGERVIYDYNLVTAKVSAAAITGDKLRSLMWADNDHVLAVTSNTQNDMGETFEEWFGLILNIGAGSRIQMYSYVAGVNQALVYGDFYRIKIDDKYLVTASGYKVPDGINMANSQGGGASFSESFNKCLYAFNPNSSA